MAYLITEDPNFLNSFFMKIDDCTFGYKAFADSRTMIKFDEGKFDDTRGRFKKEVIDPLLKISDGKIKIGRHFVFKVADIKTILDASSDCDYIRIHNRLDDQGYNKMVIIPYKSTDASGKEKSKESDTFSNTTILVEGLPCPPHPNCPLI